MALTYERLQSAPAAFTALTGMSLDEFDTLLAGIRLHYLEAEQVRLNRPGRRRAQGAGHPFQLSLRDRLLAVLIWLRFAPDYWYLGKLFGLSYATIWRYVRQLVKVIRASPYASLTDWPDESPDPASLRVVGQQFPEMKLSLAYFELYRMPRARYWVSIGGRPDRLYA